MIREEQLYINEAKLNFAVAGNGPPMIFLHNGGGFWQSWEHQLNYFSTSYTVYGIDWPGFGESDPPEGLLTLEVLYEVLCRFITEKHLSKVILVGNCIGASAAYLYAQRHPEQVRALVLVNICPGKRMFPRFLLRSLVPSLNNYPRLKKIASGFLEWVFLRTPVKRKFPRILFGNLYNPKSELFLKYIEKFKTDKQTKSRINLLFSVHTYTFKPYLSSQMNIPHLLLWGNENRVTSYSRHGRYHCRLLHPTRFELISDSGHLCMYEQPELVSGIIEHYLLLTP